MLSMIYVSVSFTYLVCIYIVFILKVLIHLSVITYTDSEPLHCVCISLTLTVHTVQN